MWCELWKAARGWRVGLMLEPSNVKDSTMACRVREWHQEASWIKEERTIVE